MEEDNEVLDHFRIPQNFDYGIFDLSLKYFLKGGLVLLFFTIPLVFYPWNTYFHVTKEFFAEMIVLSLAGIWAIWLLQKKVVKILKTPLTLPILAFIGAMLLSLSNAANMYKAITGIGIWGAYVLTFFFVVSLIEGRRWMDVLLAAALAAGLLAGIYAMFQFYGVDFSFWAQRSGKMAIFSTFGNPNYVGGYLIGVLPLAFVLFLSRDLKNKLAKGAGFLMVLIFYTALLMLYVRAAWAAIFFSGLLLLISLYFAFGIEIFKKNRYWLIGLIIAVLIITVLYSVPNPLNRADRSVASRAAGAVEATYAGSGMHQRFLQWLSALWMGAQEPIFGVGVGNYGVHYPEAQGHILSQERFKFMLPTAAKSINTHNDLFHVWAEMGALGVIAALWIIFAFYKLLFQGIFNPNATRRQKFYLLAFFSGATAILGHAMLSFPFHVIPTGLLFWLFMALSVVITRKIAGRELDLSNLPWGKIGWKWGGARGLAVVLTIVAVIFTSTTRVGTYRADVLLKRGRSITSQGHPEAAVNRLLKAAELDPGRGLVWASLGKAYLRMEQYDKAITAIKRSEGNWVHSRTYNYLGTCYFRTNRTDQAIEAYKKNIFRFPNYPVAYSNLGGVYRSEGTKLLNQGDYEGANSALDKSVVYYEQAKVFDPEHGPPAELGSLFQKLGLEAGKERVQGLKDNWSPSFSFYNKGQGPRADYFEPPAVVGQPIYLKVFYYVPWSGNFQGGVLIVKNEEGEEITRINLSGSAHVLGGFFENGLPAGNHSLRAVIQHGEKTLAVKGKLKVREQEGSSE